MQDPSSPQAFASEQEQDPNKTIIKKFLVEAEQFYQENSESMNSYGSVIKLKASYETIKEMYDEICDGKFPDKNEIQQIQYNIDNVFNGRYSTPNPSEYQTKVKNCCHMLYEFVVPKLTKSANKINSSSE